MKLRVLSPVAMLLAAGGSLMAQEVMGTITGTVRNASGAPVVGATIRVSSSKTLSDRTAQTDAQGNFRLPLLLPGDYQGTVIKEGFIGSRAEFRITAGGVIRQDFVLKPQQTATAVVEVVSTSSAVDKTQTKTASTQTLEEIQQIPTAGNYAIKSLAALAMAPSVNDSNPYYAAVRGGAQGQTQYLVNGLSVRDNITSQGRPHDVILDDLVEESQVILSPLNAKYGDSSAGLINIVEKTGSNEFAGSMRAKIDRGSWTAVRPRGFTIAGAPYGAGGPAPSDALSRVYELSVSGPIIKDRLTFTYGTRIQPSSTVARTAVALGVNTFALANGAAVPAHTFDNGVTRYIPERFTFHQGRLFFQINQNHSLDYSHAENFNQYADWGSGANTNGIDLAIPQNQTSVTKFRQLTYRGIFFGNQTLELRYGAKESTITFVSGPGDPVTVRWIPGTGGNATASTLLSGTNAVTGGGNADNRPEVRNTYNFIANYSAYFELAGSHNLDAGINWIKTKWGSVQNSGGRNQRTFFLPGRVANGDYVVFNYNTPVNGINYNSNSTYQNFIPTYTQYVGAAAGDLTKPTTSIYVNDQWTFNNNWSLMMGVRYEKYVYNDSQGERYNSSSIAPRAEVKWDIFGNNQRIFSLSYGEFRGNVHERITRTFSTFRYTTIIKRFWNQGAGLGAYTVPYSQATDPANYGQSFDYTVPNAVYGIDTNFRPDVSKETTLGYRRSYSNGASLVATLVHRKWADLPISLGDPREIMVNDPTGSGMAPKPNYMRTLTLDPDAKREYKAIELEFKTPLIPNTLYLNGSYTYSRTTGNNQMQDGTGLSGAIPTGTFYPYHRAAGMSDDIFNPVGQLGTSGNNALRLMLLYSVKMGDTKSTVSLLGRYNEGPVENRTTNAVALPPRTGTSSHWPTGSAANLPTTYTHYYNGRGQFSQSDVVTFDLAYNLEVKLQKKLMFFTTLAVTNLTNRIRPLIYNFDNSGAVQATPTGYRIDTGYANVYGGAWNYLSFQGGRDFNLDIGLRF